MSSKPEHLQLLEYHFAWPGQQPPPVDEHKLLDYVVGSNGVYARGRREGLEVCMPISFSLQPIRGLAEIYSYVQWGYPKVPMQALASMLAVSRNVCVATAGEGVAREALFYLMHTPDGWQLDMPEQDATENSVIPTATGAARDAVIELHSHHQMEAVFSPEDNLDEAQGFRVFAVIGTIFTVPTIRVRVGLWGHFFNFPADEFFEMPAGLTDCVKG